MLANFEQERERHGGIMARKPARLSAAHGALDLLLNHERVMAGFVRPSNLRHEDSQYVQHPQSGARAGGRPGAGYTKAQRRLRQRPLNVRPSLSPEIVTFFSPCRARQDRLDERI